MKKKKLHLHLSLRSRVVARLAERFFAPRACLSPKLIMLGVSRLDSSFSTTSIPFLRASATTLFAFPKSIPTTLILRFDRSRSVFASTFRARKRRALSRGSRARFSARRVASRVEASTCAKRRVGSIVEPSRRRALPGVLSFATGGCFGGPPGRDRRDAKRAARRRRRAGRDAGGCGTGTMTRRRTSRSR